eukprot:TRINITY_DN15117_c1_g2_i2.p1 TRINITY_DN15117_c1_g2~~TRINITY_DN15117_c1_g2_i2.p1  ORF type:complete len:563 (+),score=202.67 TRINITY_DN15117_c1_g2_i2:81-1691(+)
MPVTARPQRPLQQRDDVVVAVALAISDLEAVPEQDLFALSALLETDPGTTVGLVLARLLEVLCVLLAVAPARDAPGAERSYWRPGLRLLSSPQELCERARAVERTVVPPRLLSQAADSVAQLSCAPFGHDVPPATAVITRWCVAMHQFHLVKARGPIVAARMDVRLADLMQRRRVEAEAVPLGGPRAGSSPRAGRYPQHPKWAAGWSSGAGERGGQRPSRRDRPRATGYSSRSRSAGRRTPGPQTPPLSARADSTGPPPHHSQPPPHHSQPPPLPVARPPASPTRSAAAVVVALPPPPPPPPPRDPRQSDGSRASASRSVSPIADARRMREEMLRCRSPSPSSVAAEKQRRGASPPPHRVSPRRTATQHLNPISPPARQPRAGHSRAPLPSQEIVGRSPQSLVAATPSPPPPAQQRHAQPLQPAPSPPSLARVPTPEEADPSRPPLPPATPPPLPDHRPSDLPPPVPAHHSADDGLRSWLEQRDLGQYLAELRGQGVVSLAALREATEASLGFLKIGPKRKILAHLSGRLSQGPAV